MAGDAKDRGDKNAAKDESSEECLRERIEAAKRLNADVQEKRENPYKTPPNLFTTKDHPES